jgi:hypothetical protein
MVNELLLIIHDENFCCYKANRIVLSQSFSFLRLYKKNLYCIKLTQTGYTNEKKKAH